MDTGMGPDAYSVIELKMIEEILSDKTEEKRRLFEEAAGVTKYKHRRKAALRKLETTKQELLRLNDIIAEIEKNVGSLKRQVQRAERYQQYTEALKNEEINLAKYEYSRFFAEMHPINIDLSSIREKERIMAEEISNKEKNLEELKNRLESLENEL